MKKYYSLIFVFILLALSLFCSVNKGVQASENSTNPAKIGKPSVQNKITAENYPKIDGSTSTFSIVREIYENMYPGETNYPKTASKTVPSYKRLINGEVDMIIVPYASSDVLVLAGQKGVELEFIPIAAEALVFITPAENTAENITLEEVREIYLNYGIRNWNELNGPNRELVPICRNSDSGSQSQMDNLILKNKKMHPNIQKNYVELTMEGMLELVAFYHNGGMFGRPTNSYALGYTLYSYLENVTKVTGIGESLKILSFEGIASTRENIAAGTYPLAVAYYVVIRKNLPKNHSARNIIDWLQSENGNEAIVNAGLIPKTKL